MSESLEAREARLREAQEQFLAQRFGTPPQNEFLKPRQSVIGAVSQDGSAGLDEAVEPIVAENPVESASYDALLYIQAGLSKEEVFRAVQLRNPRLSEADINTIIEKAESLPKKKKKEEKKNGYENDDVRTGADGSAQAAVSAKSVASTGGSGISDD